MRFSFLLGTCFLFVIACQTENDKQPLVPLDLMKYGVPISIQAPDSAEVKTMDMGFMKDVTIKKGDDFYIQIYASQASTTDVVKILAQQLQEVKDNRYFSKVVREEDAGFIYETVVDSTDINYGFRHIKVQGDNEFIFQTGLIGTFELEDVERMYEAVKSE